MLRTRTAEDENSLTAGVATIWETKETKAQVTMADIWDARSETRHGHGAAAGASKQPGSLYDDDVGRMRKKKQRASI